MPTPSRRRPTVPPLSELDAPGRGTTSRPGKDVPDPEPAESPPVRTPEERAGGGLWTPADEQAQRAGADEQAQRAGADEQAQRAGADEQAQRAVAEERAEAARAVRAEQAATRDVVRPRRPAPALAVLAVAAVLLAARLWLVGAGALFGTGPVLALDAAVGLTAALGLALLRPRRPVATVTVPVLVVAGTVLLQPATPASAPAAACPAAPVRGTTATAVTTAPTPTRAGPGRGHPATGLLPAGCAVAVTGYCLGDSLPAGADWVDNRWLLVGRQRGPAALVSRHVSGEPGRPRFVPATAAPPAGPDLPLLPAADCGDGAVAAPGPASLEDLVPGEVPYRLVGRAPRAANVGFAVWVTADPPKPEPPLLRGGQYRQVPGGAAGPAGVRAIDWDFQALLLDLGRTGTVTVAVLAIGCTAPAAPAATGTARVTTYQIIGGRLAGPRLRLSGDEARGQPTLPGLDPDRLATEACAPPA